MNFNERDILTLRYVSILHDIGKVFIPDNILNKPGKFTNEEYDIIKAHSLKGFQSLIEIIDIIDIAESVLYHHERYDGKGYPAGIKGEDIPLFSRIIAVADSFDAMILNRSYKNAMDLITVIEELKRCKWTQFDGDVVDVFISVVWGMMGR
jgi:HD-GYP domain-containing protein (c-di-GMP phosphodiesterase class II)